MFLCIAGIQKYNFLQKDNFLLGRKDVFSLGVSSQENYFSLFFDVLDKCNCFPRKIQDHKCENQL